MVSPYEKCPVFEDERWLLRLIEGGDAEDLLKVYADEKALPFFNSDNCTGDFYCPSVENVRHMIVSWLREYERKEYVRWAIIDKAVHQTIGTIELFNRRAKDFFDDCGLLRIDLRSDYESEKYIAEILSIIVVPAFELFDCRMMATKIPAFALERRRAAEAMGFAESKEKLVGWHDGRIYSDYYALWRDHT